MRVAEEFLACDLEVKISIVIRYLKKIEDLGQTISCMFEYNFKKTLGGHWNQQSKKNKRRPNCTKLG